MEQLCIGYIFMSPTLTEEEKIFLKVAKKKNIKLIMFNVADKLIEKEIEKKARQCDIIFNNTAGYIALEILKTLENIGIKTVDSSKVYYYTEDKWMFFLKCKEHGIPTPDTILLSGNLNSAKKELEEFGRWPVILKLVQGEHGEFVKKADAIDEAMPIIRELWEKRCERLPVIGQEFIRSPSYRVTVIGDKIVQTALKYNYGWKSTGVYAEKIGKFEVDRELEKLVKKIIKVCKIKICGIDFLKRDNKWFVIEVNAEPSFEFFEDEMEMIIEKVIDFIKKEIKS